MMKKDDSKLEYIEMTVPPELASEWLKLNTNNYREVKPSTLKKYTEAMAAGRWQATGDPIRFGADGTLYDGQHRLMAQAATKTTNTYFVIWGLNESARDALDQGASRYPADVLSNHGVDKYAKGVASVLRFLATYDAGLLVHAGSSYVVKPSLDEYPSLLAKYPEAETHQAWAHHQAKDLGFTPTGLAGARTILDRFGSPQKVEEFWAGVENRVPTSEGDPRRTLAKWARGRHKDQKSNGRIANAAQTFAIFVSWNAWIEGRSLSNIRFESRKAQYSEDDGSMTRPAVYRDIPKPI